MKMIKKISKIVVVATMAIMFISTTNVFAGNANHDFKFQIGSWGHNGRVETGRYRKTTKPKNAWKVNLTKSGEGNNTYSDFWLERYNGENVSDYSRVMQGSGEHYKCAYSGASQTTVYLTGENNNYNNHSYYVEGYWDEETGVIVE